MFNILKIQRFCRLIRTSQPSRLNSFKCVSLDLQKLVLVNKFDKLYQVRRHLQINSVLQKYNKKSQDIDSDEEDNDFDFKDERDSKVVKTKVNSLRADLLLKAGLGMARNKVETFFYESKIRVNGKKLSKKSVQLNVGDEIDVVRGFSQTNPTHLVVSRVIILAANAREDDTISVQLRRYKSLLIENYAGPNLFKSSETADHGF